MSGGAQPKLYEFFEHTADIGVHIYGSTLEDLFQNAAAALYEALGELKKAGDCRQRTLKLQAESSEDLLHDWLSELLYEVEANKVLYDQIEITELTPLKLDVSLRGSLIDFSESITAEEVKAVTYHQLRVEQFQNRDWQATVIFDV